MLFIFIGMGILAILITVIAEIRVKSAYNKYLKIMLL